MILSLFEPSHYEEWQGGQKIDSGSTATTIYCTFFEEGNSVVDFFINDLQSKVSDCSFDMAVTLEDRILLCSNPSRSNADILATGIISALFPSNGNIKFYEPDEPVVASLFFQGRRLVKMSFTMCNPERLVELY